jgi:hypothetical protein
MIVTSFYLESCVWSVAISRCILQNNSLKFCANLENVLRKLWQWLYKRSRKEAWAVHRKCKLIVTERNKTGEAQSQEHAHNFLWRQGGFHKEFVLGDQTVNSAYYCDVLRRMPENMRRFRSDLWRQENWMLHHDNTQSHTSFSAREFFTKSNKTVVTHPLWFSLFLQLEIKLMKKKFDVFDLILVESQAMLNTLTKRDFQDACKKKRNGAYARKGTALRAMVASRPEVRFHHMTVLVPVIINVRVCCMQFCTCRYFLSLKPQILSLTQFLNNKKTRTRTTKLSHGATMYLLKVLASTSAIDSYCNNLIHIFAKHSMYVATCPPCIRSLR